MIGACFVLFLLSFFEYIICVAFVVALDFVFFLMTEIIGCGFCTLYFLLNRFPLVIIACAMNL